jgi:O-antigen ligase
MKDLVHTDQSVKWMIGLAILQLLAILSAIVMDQPLIPFLPVAIVVGLLVISDVRWIYALFAVVLPFSVEVELPGGLGTDLPSEPIMWILTGVGMVYLASRPMVIMEKKWLHPVSLLIIAHVMWIGIAAFFSQNVVISLKFLLAKIWYVIPFYFLFVLIHKDEERISSFFKWLIWSMSLAIMIVMVRHAGYSFSFKSINEAVHPIFRNHVNYACMLIALVPYVWVFYREKKSTWWLGIMLLFLAAIYLSYTRAAMVALFIGIGAYYIVRWRLSRVSIYSSIILVIFSIPYFLHDNKYLDYAPEYEKAIAHYKFDNLIEATYKFEDISTMERLYRWVAGKEMIQAKPVFGFGPGTFYSYYQDYSIAEFQTYVSDNPEKSGIHNYYLMTMVEQGIFGFLLFFLIVVAGIIYGEKAYHALVNPGEKRMVMASTVSLVIIASILIINDLIEADKVGPFFFLALGIILVFDMKTRKASNIIRGT